MKSVASDPEAGAALLLALLAAILLAAIGAGLITLADTDGTVAHNHRAGEEVLYAVDAAVERALAEVGASGSWTDLLTGAVHSPMFSGSSRPVAPWGETLDLQTLSSEVQAESDAGAAWGLNNPAWQLFASGSLDLAAGGPTGAADAYLVVWVADDPSEIDNNPSADSNDTLLVRALAMNALGMRREVQVAVSRNGAQTRLLAWRLLQ